MATEVSLLERRPWMVVGALCALCAATLLSSLDRFGIWDPWELQVADHARGLALGHGVPFSQARRALLASLGFRMLGVHEWAGRLPGVLCGIGAVLCSYALGLRFVGRHAGFIAGLVTLSSPLFLLNVLPMGGQALGFLLQALTIWAGATTLLPTAMGARTRILLAVTALASAWAATMVYGMLVGSLPPLLALGAVSFLTLHHRNPRDSSAWAIRLLWMVLALAGSAVVAWAVHADVDRYSLWTGGVPTGLLPVGFDQPLERIFHGLAPWSALLPLALVYPFVAETSDAQTSTPQPSAAAPIGILCALWCAAGYAAQTLFLARYSRDAVFLPVVGVGLLLALLLYDLSRGRLPGRFVGLVAVLFSGLLLRDYAMYPESPLEGLAIHKVNLPKVFNPKIAWGALLSLFAAAVALPFATTEEAPWHDTLRAPYRLLLGQFRRGAAFRLWLGIMAAGLVGLLVLGIVAWVAPRSLSLTTLGERVARGSVLAVLALPLAIAAGQALYVACSHLSRFRVAPVLALGAVTGLYIAHVFLPALSGHLSPRDVYESFHKLAGRDAVLAEFKVGGGAAEYYIAGKVQSFTNIGSLTNYLGEDARRWAAVPSSELPLLDSRFRRAHGRHLFVADAENGQVTLVTNQPVAGHRDQNPLADLVLDKPPATIEHPVTAFFDGKLELLGYDVSSRRPDVIGSGESITLTWYYRVLKRVGTDYKLFVHIDGSGTRINGDHNLVDGNYPTSLWEIGDVIVDRHAVEIPASTRVGTYEILMGFYKNERRMTVDGGPHDDSNRVRAGALRIQ